MNKLNIEKVYTIVTPKSSKYPYFLLYLCLGVKANEKIELERRRCKLVLSNNTNYTIIYVLN